ncbi:MAG: NPCBM/NEW2 domain-containing protein [Planctomycetes bacterium]|nr:NPCBM/NEW2 domain-containing protein [Planctomycetota bacterium]
MKMRRVEICLLGAVLLIEAVPAEAQDFIAHTADGPLLPAPPAKIGDDWSLRLSGQTPRLIAGTDWYSLRRDKFGLPDWPKTNFLLLTSGDRVPIDPAGSFRLDDDRLHFDLGPPCGVTRNSGVSVPLAYVIALVLATTDGEEDAELFLARLKAGKRPADLLLLKNGDRIEGKLKDVTRERGFWIDIEGRKVQTPISQAAVLAINTSFQAKPRVKRTHASVAFEGGGRVLFANLRIDEERKLLAGKTLAGFDVETPLEKVAAIDLRMGRAVYLSDMKPKAYEHKPFLGVAWPLVVDGSVTGRPLRLGGQTFDKGLGMHAPCRVTYTLDGGFRWFEASVGLDARTGQRGHVRVSILVDGKEREGFDRKELTGGGMPWNLRIDVRKAREVALVADMGDFGDVQAHVDWADARLIRD